MSRESFLARVRQAAAAGRAYRVAAGADLSQRVGYIGAGDDAVQRFAAEVTAVGGQAHVVDDHETARATLASLITAQRARRALCWQHPLLERLQLGGLLASLNVEQLGYDRLVHLPAAEQRQLALSAAIGISSTTYAVAETGTLAVAAGKGSERLVSLVPPVHVAVVEAQQIVPDLFDLFDRLQESDPQRIATNLTLITGPSKTGDIELKLTTGVHGPGWWHVIVIRRRAG
jgi:L-lactate dehydrogenase complex protein LldG